MSAIEALIADRAKLSNAVKVVRDVYSGVSERTEEYRMLVSILSDAAANLESIPAGTRKSIIPLLCECMHCEWGLEGLLKLVTDAIGRGVRPNEIALHAQAACRREDQFERAEEYFSALHTRLPEDGYVAFLYSQSLLAVGSWTKVEQLSQEERAAPRITEWLTSQWAQLLTSNFIFDEARSWTERLSFDASLGKELERRISSFEDGREKCPLPTKVISLDRDNRKWHLSKHQLEVGGYQPQKFKAVDGLELPKFALDSAAQSPSVNEIHGAGAIATAMSHIHVLEEFLSSNAEQILVLEDDAAPFFHWQDFHQLIEQQANVEMLWVNERMSLQFGQSAIPEFSLLSPWQTLGERNTRLNGIGLDGYIVNRMGAEKLLEQVNIDRVSAHIDAQYAAYCISKPSEGTDESTLSRSQQVISRLRSSLATSTRDNAVINSKCLSVPMFWANNHGSSQTTRISSLRRH